MAVDAGMREGQRVAENGPRLAPSSEAILTALYDADPWLGGIYISELMGEARRTGSTVTLAELFAANDFPQLSQTARSEFEAELRRNAEGNSGAAL